MIVPSFQEAPFSEEAERATLGSIFIDPACFLEVSATLKSAEDFYIRRHMVIYQAIERVKERKDEIDLITVADDLENTGDLDNVGGRAYLVDLMNNQGTSTKVYVYANLVKRAAIRRRMTLALVDMHKKVNDESLNIEDVQSQADTAWLNATSDITENNGVWMSDVIGDVYDELERAMSNGGNVAGLKTGLSDLDQAINGLEPEQLIIFAGRPGMGKSAIMDNIVLNMATQGIPVFYATSERGRNQVIKRMLAIHTQVPMSKQKSGNVTGQEASRLTDGIAELCNLPIYFDDNPMPRPRDIFAQADWMVKRHGCEAIFFDGMYRSHTGISEFDKSERLKYGRIALDLKTMARTLKVPVATTHQLSRAVEQRQDKRPMMSDLRESGRIEEETDKIIFLYRDIVYNENSEFPNQCDLIISKH